MENYVKDLVSVIVPVYNVEEYLEECVDSLLNQSYKNIEILLIDDGSTDSSGAICDEYAKKNDCVSAYHKKNGGLSDARNYGLERINGEYVSFVDSDDYVDSDFILELINACKSYNTNISCVRWKPTEECEKVDIKVTGNTTVLDSEIVLMEMIGPIKYGITVSVWDRLYRRELIDGMKFPVGKCYEDILFSTKAIIKASKIVYIDKELYNYRVRKGSITRPTDGEFDKKLITDKLSQEISQIRLVDDQKLLKVSRYYKFLYYYETLCVYVVNPYKEYDEVLKGYLKSIRLGIMDLFKVNCPLTLKVSLIIRICIIKIGLAKNKLLRKD